MIKYRGVVVPFTVEDWEAYMPDTPAKNQEIVDVLRDIWATTTRCVDLILALSPREGESAVIMLGRADVEMEQKLAQYADLGFADSEALRRKSAFLARAFEHAIFGFVDSKSGHQGWIEELL